MCPAKAKVSAGGRCESLKLLDDHGQKKVENLYLTAKPGYKLDKVIKNRHSVNLSDASWDVSKSGATYLGEVNLSDSYTVLFRRDD